VISPLDDLPLIRRLDPGDMLGALRGLPQQCREAWDAAQRFDPGLEPAGVDRIVVLGMGGSAIAGDLLRALLQRECAVPVFNVRGYEVPPFVDQLTLVIASSFSGDTEEVLSAFEQALARPCPKIAITTGGQLLAMARANGIAAFTFEFKGEPRAAIGWGFMPLLAISERLGLTQGVERDVDEMIGVLETLVAELEEEIPADRNPAKRMAEALHERLPVVYGAGPLIEVARRWKTQLNESAKTWAFHEEIPEAHHNAIIGYELPKDLARDTAVIFLESDVLIHPRVRLRYEYTKDLLRAADIAVLTGEARGRSALAQMMSLVLFGDYVATYLAFLYGVDPTPTTVIDELKAWLRKQ
jgi:glucose/mannose-6-phosphate isomerase